MHFELDILGQEYPQYFGPMLRSSSFSDVDSAKANSVTGRSTRLGRFDASCSGKAGRRPDQAGSRSDSSPKHQASEFGVIPPRAAGNSPTFHGRMPGLVCNAQAQPLQRRPGDCAMLAPRIGGHDFFMTSAGFPPAM
jgi:hypothetical protein